MVVKWKGVEPKTPEAIEKAKEYEPPEAIIEEAPDIEVEDVGRDIPIIAEAPPVEEPLPPPPTPIIEEAPAVEEPLPPPTPPIIEEAPPVKAPLPPPPTPIIEEAPPIEPPPIPIEKPEVVALEPVIPEPPFRLPHTAKVLETDVQDRPTSYELGGKKYYTPHNLMWYEYGFKSEEQYSAPGTMAYFDFPWQATTPPPYIPFSSELGDLTPKGKIVLVPRTQAEALVGLKGEAQFKALQGAGVISHDSKFVPGEEGYDDPNWQYIPAGQLKKLRGQALASKMASKLEPGAEFYEQYAKDWYARHIQLKDGIWITTSEWEALPEEYKVWGKEQGFVAMDRAMRMDANVAQRNYENAIMPMVQEDYDEYMSASPEGKFGILMGMGLIAEGSTFAGVDDVGNPTFYASGEAPEPANITKIVAESLIPGMYLAKHWGELDWLPSVETVGWRDTRTGKVYTEEERVKIITDYDKKRDDLAKQGKMFSAEWDELTKQGHPQDKMVREIESHLDSRLTALALDLAILLPVVGWAGKVGSASARTAAEVSRVARIAQAARSVGYAARTLPKGMLWDFPKGMLVGPRLKTLKGLGEITIYPIIHPVRTTKTIANIATGKVQLGNIIPEGTITAIGGMGRTIPLRTVSGQQVNVHIPTSPEAPPTRTTPKTAEYVALEKAGKLPKETITVLERVKVDPRTYSEATYNKLLKAGKIGDERIYDPTTERWGEVELIDPATQEPYMKTTRIRGSGTFETRVPTYEEWRMAYLQALPLKTTTQRLTPSEYEVWKILKGKSDLRHPYTGELITPESAARFKVEAIQGVARQHGFKSAVEIFGKDLVKVVFPDAGRYIKAETHLQKMLAPERAATRQRIAENVTRFVYEDLNATRITPAEYARLITKGYPPERFLIQETPVGRDYFLKGTAGTEVEMAELARAGYLQAPEGQVIETAFPSRIEAIKELAMLPSLYTVIAGGAWMIEPKPIVPQEVIDKLTLKYPVFVTDPSLIAEVWAVRAGTIKAYGEMGVQLGTDEEWIGLFGKGLLVEPLEERLEVPSPFAEIRTKMPMPIGEIEAEEAHKELLELLQNKLVLIEEAPGAFTIKATGEMIALGGTDLEGQARYLKQAIETIVRGEGYGRALQVFGLLPVMAVYPYAIEMAIAEEDETWRMTDEERRDALSKLVRDERVLKAINSLSPDKRAEVMKSLENIGQRFTDLGTPRITAPEEGKWVVTPRGEIPAIEVIPELGKVIPLGVEPTRMTKPELKVLTEVEQFLTLMEKGEPEVFPVPTRVVAEEAIAIRPEIEPEIIEIPKVVRFPVIRRIEEPIPEPMLEPILEPMLKPMLEPILEPMLKPMLEPILEPMLKPIPEPLLEPIPEPLLEPIPEPLLEPIPEPVPEPIPEPVPEPIPEPIPEPVPLPPPPLPLPLPEKEMELREQVAKIVPGTLAYKMGEPSGGPMWKIIPPPYRDEDKFTMRQAPPGAYKFASGKGSAYKTIQVLAGKPPKDVEVDLGWAKVRITSKDGKLDIDFVHDVEANVGKREFTIGMGEGQIPLEVADAAKAMGISGGELIERARAGEDVYKLVGMEKPEGVPEHIEEKIPKSYIPKHLVSEGVSGYNGNGQRERLQVEEEPSFPKKTKDIEQELKEMDELPPDKKPRRDKEGEIAEEYYLGRKIESYDLGVNI